jgi:hypothetical protein
MYKQFEYLVSLYLFILQVKIIHHNYVSNALQIITSMSIILQSSTLSPMDKVKKILSSPITRRKNANTLPLTSTLSQPDPATKTLPQGPGYFGVPLEDILQREGTDVPHLVTKICTYLLKHGKISLAE